MTAGQQAARGMAWTAGDGADDALVIGVSVNNLSGITGHSYTVTDLLHAAREAEAMGFGAVWVHDAPGGRRTLAAYDPIALLSAVAASTSRILLCAGILTPQLRNPVNLAASWGTLHELSEGRSVLGVGSGAGKSRLVERQFQALAALRGADASLPERLYEKRGKLFEEAVTIVRRLWHEDKVSYEGEFFQFRDVTLGDARPTVPPPIIVAGGNYYPALIGGPVHHEWRSERAGTYQLGPYQRVSRLGDGWITPHATPDEYATGLTNISTELTRDPKQRPFIWAYNAFVNIDDDPKKAWLALRTHLEHFHGPPVGDDVVDRWGIVGPPETVAARLNEYVRQGARMFQLVIGSHDQAGQMRLLAEKVLPLVKNSA